MAPFNSKDGVNVCVEAPYGKNHNLNILRNAVLRQYYGCDTEESEKYTDVSYRYSYGVGAGSAVTSVGSDSSSIITRRMTEDLQNIANQIHWCVFKVPEYRKKLLCERRHEVPICEDDFNHCTVLLYYSIKGVKHVSELSKHCDCTYRKDGSFASNSNSQKENSITASLTICDSRLVNFFLRKMVSDKNTNEKDSTQIGELLLSHGDIMIIHPDDERPFKQQTGQAITELCQIQHGDIQVDSETFSIGLLFRTVNNVQPYHKEEHTLLSMDNVNGSIGKERIYRCKDKVWKESELLQFEKLIQDSFTRKIRNY